MIHIQFDQLLPSELLFNLTKLHESNNSQFNKTITCITQQYTQQYNTKLKRHITKHYKTYKNPHRINAIRKLFTRLQEEAHPDTTDIIFFMNCSVVL